MKRMTTLALLMSVMFVSACNTAAGLARDTYGAGRFVVNTVTDDD